MASIFFNMVARKVIKDVVKHAWLVLLACAEAADKAQSGARHLPNQGVATLREGRLARQRSGDLACDMLVVGIHGVQSPLGAELAQSTEQGFGAPLRCGHVRKT
jgi:hypothetical protein